MRYLSEDQVTQMMGIGYLGEVRQGPDGNLYQYVQGVDGLGNPIGGIWSRVKRWTRRAVRRALPYVQQFAPLIPGVGPAVSVLTSAIPAAPAMAPVVMPTSPAEAPTAMPTEAKAPAETGTAGWGLGALYQAPDGTLYQQVQGLDEDEELRGLSEDEATQMMGIGFLGEVRQGPDGNLYQYVQGLDGLGNPIGSWWRRLVRRALPFARQFAPFIPGGAAALTAVTPLLKQAGVAGYQGLAEDDELRGLAEDEELRGLDEDEELRGIDEDEELRGFAEDEELRGLEEDEELRGLDADEELQGFAEDEELRGVAEDQDMQGIDGYVRQDGMSGLEAFVPQEPPQTRWHVTPAQASEVWKPLW
jgi:hypothetical protein